MLTVSVASTPCPPPRLAAAAGRQAAQITRRHAPQHAVAPRHSRPTWGTRDGRRTCRRGLYASSNGHADGDAAADIAAEQQQSQQQPEQQQADPPPAALPGRAAAPPPSKASLIFTILVVTVTAVANRVLYKMSLVPLGNYVFFLAQLQTFGYLLVYFAVLALRYRSGQVSKAMLAFPMRAPGMFLAIGLVEALSSLLGFLGAANLPGVVLPLLAQTILLWQVLLAVTLLKKRLGAPQLLGVSLVMCGVGLAAWPQGGGSPLDGISPFYAGIFVISMVFPALDTIFKERVFRQARAELKEDLDLFVVNSIGSLGQSFFVFLLLPIMTALRGMSITELPGYLAQGWHCFRGLTPSCGSDCAGAPLLPLAYVLLNLLFNISALELIRRAGNVAISLLMSSIVPLTILAFTIPLPYLPAAPPLGPLFLLGTVVLLAGLLVFNAPLWLPVATRGLKAWAADNGSGNSSGGGSSSGQLAVK